jgi:hypothetical protein
MPGAVDLEGVVVPLNIWRIEREEGAGLDVGWGRPVVDEAGYGAVDCFCSSGENLGVILRGLAVGLGPRLLCLTW